MFAKKDRYCDVLRMNQKDFLLFSRVILLITIIFLSSWSGCIDRNQKCSESTEGEQSVISNTFPLTVPDWNDESYHDYEKTKRFLFSLEDRFPDYVDLFSIGKSVLRRDIWCILISNERKYSKKYDCVIDGCIHGNEWEAGESCLYLAEYLLINAKNASMASMLNETNIFIIPLLNPDGRESDERWNENGIDLNRNFDVHFGRLRSGNFPLGKLFGRFKIPLIHHPFRKNILLSEYSTNCGREPFSEPETRSLKLFMESLDNLAFYMNCHTALHGVLPVVNVDYKPEFFISENEKNVYDYAEDWISANSEYSSCHVDDVSFSGAGFAHHWSFKTFRAPSFCFELLSTDYEPRFGHGDHDHLNHWMQTTLPVFMFMLVNREQFNNWEIPSNYPKLPRGIPPDPIH